jgi:hypothetical protein
MPKKPKSNSEVRRSSYEDFESYLDEILVPTLKKTIRLGLETMGAGDEDDVLEVLRKVYGYAAVVLAEVGHARGVVDPLLDLAMEAHSLRYLYPELELPIV